MNGRPRDRLLTGFDLITVRLFAYASRQALTDVRLLIKHFFLVLIVALAESISLRNIHPVIETSSLLNGQFLVPARLGTCRMNILFITPFKRLFHLMKLEAL